MVYYISMKSNTKGGEQMPKGFSLKTILILYVLVMTTLFSVAEYKEHSQFTFAPEVYPDGQIINDTKIRELTQEEKIILEIKRTFPENTRIMIAIALEESGLNPNAVGYNCRYKLGGNTYDRLTNTYINLNIITKEKNKGYVSTACRKGDEKYAWSKDGGILQVNNAQPHELTIAGNIIKAREIYDVQGLNAWVSYTSGHYKKHLAKADEILKNTD